jgi:hypothetical protein
LNFQESGYPVWAAKFNIIKDCDFGSTVLLGDSRAQAAFMPTRLSSKATNLGFGAATPLELFIVASNLFDCPNRPDRVMVSLASVEFTLVQPFLWENGARYGFFNFKDLRRIAAAADNLNDLSLQHTETRDGQQGLLRDVIYGFHFPSIYLNSLIQSRVFGRHDLNLRLLFEASVNRGFLPFPPRGDPSLPGREVGHVEFQPLPIQNYFFDRLLALAQEKGIDIDFVAAPVNSTTINEISPSFQAGFTTYLRDFQARYKGFHVVSPLFYVAPLAAFGDPEHLNVLGAERFTDGLASCLDKWRALPVGQSQSACSPFQD